ncbi:MAG: MFS transporter [Methanomicrobiaceae archaeon]|nr:MFS transporter [Methanomicrobiaceae archaeon]
MSVSPRIAPGKKRSYYFILLFGIVAMFGDIIYEGARSVTGPYLYILGASALTVGFVAGFGEFSGYALRLLSGYIADSTKHYWALTFIGYGMLIAVPFLAFAGSWEIAAVLFIAERMGKGIRAPAKDAILSNITKDVGRGWGFGIHEALDQIGAILGPLIFTAAYIARGDYQSGFALLIIPFILMMATLVLVRRRVPDTVAYEKDTAGESSAPPLKSLAPYGIFTALTMCGFVAFPLVSYHFSSAGVVPDAEIPVFYAIAMGVDAFAALAAGRIYDRRGLITLVILPVLIIIIPLLAFSSDYIFAIFSAVIWGCVMGIQETILRAAVADYTHISKRGTAYGVFNTIYGLSWFFGSVVIGFLYGISFTLVFAYVIFMEILSIPVFFLAKRGLERNYT